MDELIDMTKDGEVIAVHPSCVADHERNGWRIAPPPAETATEPNTRAKRKE